MKISLVVAVARNNVIGINNQLPWYLPEDLRYFKRVTMGKPVIMGRKTYESIGKPLPGRANIVITRNRDYAAAGIKVVYDLEEAINVGEAIAEIDGQEEIMVIGGEEIFRASMDIADRLYLTEVHADVKGDTFFPVFKRDDYQEFEREDHAPSGSNPYHYSFVLLEKTTA